MAPRIRSQELGTRTARAKLLPRRKPYAITVSPGVRLGYRRNEGAGTWSVICADGAGGSWLKRIAVADDHEDADGKAIMDFWQATDAARNLAKAPNGSEYSERPATVAEAIDAYKADLKARDGRLANAAMILKHASPAFLSRPVGMLTMKEIVGFRNGLLTKDLSRATANRYMKVLFACLTAAARLDDRITNTKAWKLPALPDASEARNVILKESQVHAVVTAAYGISHEFGLLVEVLAVTGTRVSQAARASVGDLLPDRLLMPSSRKGSKKKSAERQPLPVPPSLTAKLRVAAGDRLDNARLLLRHDGEPWGPSEHQRPFRLTAKAAGLDPEVVTAYALRHSSVVRLLLSNVPTRVVAAHHDTSVKMIESNYSKYITSHSDAMIRRALPDFDQMPLGDNVVAIKR